MKKAWQMFSNVSAVLVFLFILVAIGIAIGKTTSNSPMVTNGEFSENKHPIEIKEANTNSISIPGFERLTFQARQTEQQVDFYNPEQNNCYFEIMLLLPDETEIFRSGLLAPGKTITSITLQHALEPGVYERAILRYSCYSIGNMEPLNGTDTIFDLEVLQ